MKDINQIQIYQAENGELEIKLDTQSDTVWLSQDQIALLFEKDRTVITKHINNTYKEQELEENLTRAFFAHVQNEGVRKVKREVAFYNLDMVLSVGYRTNSKKATKFRQWANSILKDYIQKGYVLNQKLLEVKQNQIIEIQQTLEFLVRNGKNLLIHDPFLEILKQYTNSLITLNQFDENRIQLNQGEKGIRIEIAEFKDLIQTTKKELISKNEATELFGKEYEGKFESSVGAIFQTYGGQDVYPTLDEKAANLLYLIVKNHSFTDGNKRIGSILFVYFLAKNNYLHKQDGEIKISGNTLVALALLVAQSKPEDKEIMIKLIMKLIQS